MTSAKVTAATLIPTLDNIIRVNNAEEQAKYMKIDLDKAYAIIDEYRGRILKERKQFVKGTDNYTSLSRRLDLLNRLKKEFAIVSDSDQIPLGL